MNIGIIYNSFAHKKMLPEEREMRDTGLSIGRHLAGLGHQVRFFDMDSPESIEDLCRSRLDAAFNVCERVHDDPRGEAYAAALLESLGIPHTRTHAAQISLGIRKERVKAILEYYRIPTPRYQVFRSPHDALRPDLAFPLFVKGAASENSIGIDRRSRVTNTRQLRAKVRQIITRLNQPALVEEYIGGRELSAAILPGAEDKVLILSEVLFKDLPPERRFLDYSAKWKTRSDQYRRTSAVCPAELTDDERETICRVALRCFHVLGLDSYTRVDLRFRDGVPYVLEVNQNPSISEVDSGYVRTCGWEGLDYDTLLSLLLQNALRIRALGRRS